MPLACNVGDEGGFAPDIQSIADGFDVIMAAVRKSGLENNVVLAIDAAASEFFEEDSKKYNLDKKNPQKEGGLPTKLSSSEMINFYKELITKYPSNICNSFLVISLEDPLDQDDWSGWVDLTKDLGIQIVADDLTVTNPERIQKACDLKASNALLLKVNQIGTLTESLQAYSDLLYF